MKGYFWKLSTAELRKTLTLPVIILLSALFLLALAGTFLPLIFGAVGEEAVIRSLNFAEKINSAFGVIIPLLTFILCSGIVHIDLKSNWLRSVVARPVSRHVYIISKINSLLIIVVAMLLLMVTIPTIVFSLIVKVPVEFGFWQVLFVHVAGICQALMYIIICTWMSCWIPGFLNIIIFIVWMFSNSIITQLASAFFWDTQWIMIASDFYFPSGFSDSCTTVIAGGDFPFESILWGISALAGFAALTFWFISFIQIDKNRD